MNSAECQNEDQTNAEETEPRAGALHQTLKVIGFTLLGAAVAVPAVCLYLGKRALSQQRTARQRRSLSSTGSRGTTQEQSQPIRINLVPGAPQAQVEAEPETPEVSSPQYIASTERDKFHVPSCRWARQIQEEHRLIFTKREEAIERGYSPCGTCSP
jgi:hypothetical protein